MRKFRIYAVASMVAAVALVGIVSSCSDEQLVKGGGIRLDKFEFLVGTSSSSTAETRAAVDKAPLADAEEIRVAPVVMPDGDTLYLTCTVSDMDDPFQSAVEVEKSKTRGAMVTTTNFAEKYNNFKIDGYQKSSSTAYFEGKSVAKTEEFHTDYDPIEEACRIWKIQGVSEDLMWPSGGDELTLYAWAPAECYPTESGPAEGVYGHAYPKVDSRYTGKTTFKYKAPQPVAGDTHQAESLLDLLFTTYGPATPDGQCVPLQFHHMLSAVNFREGDLKGGYIINKVQIKNVQTAAECFYTPGTSGPSILWNAGGDRVTYTQEYNHTVSADHKKVDGDGKTTSPIENATNTATFFFVPQNTGVAGRKTSEDVQISITYQLRNGGDAITTDFISLGGMTWQVGKKYTYSLSLPAYSVSIEPQTDNKIKNTGTAKCYIRAAILGNWIEPSRTGLAARDRGVVANWTDGIDKIDTGNSTNDGSFSNLPGTNWSTQQSDGYFYYRKPVNIGTGTDAYTTQLFSAYQQTAASPTHGFTSGVEMNIYVQAVKADAGKASFSAAWGSSKTGLVDAIE